MRTIIYRNLLSGVDDVDGDGIAPPEEAFIITIRDGNPANNEIVDGCGFYEYDIVPHPDSNIVGFVSGSGNIMAFDVTPPALVSPATVNGRLFTPELDEITLNTLPASVPRTFTVSGTTGMPIEMDNTLMGRLIKASNIPFFNDACSDITVTVSDQIIENDRCDDILIRRTFTANDISATCSSDARGNGGTEYTLDILLERPDIAEVMPPAESVNYECDDPAIMNNPFPDPNPEDFPFFNRPDGPFYLSDDVYGNVGVSFTNSPAVNVCEKTTKFIRTYSVIDWCNTDEVKTFTQLVKVGDNNPPTIIAPTQDLDRDGRPDTLPYLLFTTNVQDCGAIINTDRNTLMVTDGCSSIESLEAVVLINGEEDNLTNIIDVKAPNPADRLTPVIPVGDHILRYFATDECGNESQIDVVIRVEDQTGPVVIVEDELNVSLNSNGFAQVDAEDLDRGSYDDCGEVTISIAFANPVSLSAIGAFGPTITFSCIDVGVVPVLVKVTDDEGNENTRMATINVIDNSAPVCIAPGHMTVGCVQIDNLFPEDIELAFANNPAHIGEVFDVNFGRATSLDNCGDEQSLQSIDADINDCGVGRITRTFSVTDGRGILSTGACEQVITVQGTRDYTVTFPADAATSCGTTPEYDDLSFTAMGCDMIVSYVETDTFFSSSDACFKLRRTMEVINWCEYNGTDAFYAVHRDADGDGDLEEETFLHVIPNGNPGGNGDVAVLDNDDNRNNGFIAPVDAADNNVVTDGRSGYANSPSRGAFRYVQYIKVTDTNAPVITNISSDATPSTNCSGGGIQINYSILDDCSALDLDTRVELDLFYNSNNGFSINRLVTPEELTNDNGEVTIFLEDIEIGTHALRVRASDGCGNADARIIPFTIEDNTALAPLCVGSLIFVLNSDGQGGGIANVEAEDYIIDVASNCTNAPLEYAIFREIGEADQAGFVPGADQPFFEVTCAEDGTDIAVRVYTFTPDGTNSFCRANAEIVAARSVDCSGAANASLSGFITSPDNQLLRDIPVHISDMKSMNDMMYTDDNGSFLFTPLEEGAEYMVQPAMEEIVNLRRVRTSDITAIQGHVLGRRPITNPYRLIAADVNGDGILGIMDMIAINRIILGFEESFPQGPNWRFIRRDFDLEGLTEGWDTNIFPNTFTVEELDGHNRDADFIAIEMGDVFVTNEGRSTTDIVTTDATLAAGERTSLTLAVSELTALQGTLEALPGLAIESWSSDLLTTVNVNDLHLDEGLLAFAYWNTAGVMAGEFITLELRADVNLRLSDYLSVTDRLTFREAASLSGTTTTLNIIFSETPGGGDFVLHQNFPNPVAASTTIAFDLPLAAPVQLAVYDLRGRRLLEQNLQGVAGRNTLTISNDDLDQTTGVLSYTIMVGGERLTKRMTVVATR